MAVRFFYSQTTQSVYPSDGRAQWKGEPDMKHLKSTLALVLCLVMALGPLHVLAVHVHIGFRQGVPGDGAQPLHLAVFPAEV